MDYLKNRLDKKMDRILFQEESGNIRRNKTNRAFRRALNNKLAVMGAVIFFVIVLMCIFAPVFTSFNPLKIDMRNGLQPPNAKHIFGTDKLGRDIFSRILYGGRLSILIGFGSAVGAAFIGVLLGCYSGYKDGIVDALLLRISEIFISFPQIILVLILVSLVGQSMLNLIFVFIITGWISIYRMTRAQILSLREKEYVEALKVFGINDLIICYKHILPNALSPVIVNITLSTASFILQESALSFLGLGVPVEMPTWGNILNVANDISVLKNNWWIWLPVGTVISIFVLSINFIGDGLRDSTDSSLQG